MSVYVESSFLVSLYRLDAHSATAQRIIHGTQGALWITRFVELEFVNALGLSIFRNEKPQVRGETSLSAFDRDVRTGVYAIKPMLENVFDRARQVSLSTTPDLGTRASDLLHVAAALELGADAFYTFDRQQAKLAKEMKLRINEIS